MEHIKDNDILMSIQKRFLDGDSLAWSEMWVHTARVAEKMLLFEARKYKLKISHDFIQDMVQDISIYTLRRFKTKPGFCYRKNFTSNIYLNTLHFFYRNTNAQKFEKYIKTYSRPVACNTDFV
ncbi:MAG: hypothetical protein IJJ66_01580 [Treponema sp.]|nr:hypothetical protein [Treponema sp.]